MGSELQDRPHRARTIALAALIALAWLAIDQATKAAIEGSFAVGELVAGPYLGLVQFRLVHNTGMAWGLLDDSTLFLGVLSVVVVAALAVYLVAASARANLLETIGGALVIGGGLGNALDRFALGYVVDFIETVFMDFPVFNVADIGVTCGFVAFIAGFLIHEHRLEQQERLMSAEAGPEEGAPVR